MSGRRKLGVAVIGLGMAAEPHVLSLGDLSDQISMVYAASPSRVRTDAFARRHSYPTTNDIAGAIAHPDADIVLLLTPANTHADLSIAAMRAGKHVLIEKPLDARIERAEEIVRAADTLGRCAGVVLQHRFRPAAQRLRAVIDAGELGQIEAAHLHFAWWRPQSYYDEPGRGTYARDGGGVMLTQAIHSVDLMRWFVGPMTVIASSARASALHTMEAEDHVVAMLRLDGGGVGSIVATTAACPGYPETLDIIGSLGTARLTGGALDLAFVDGRSEHIVADIRSGAGAGAMDFAHDAHLALLKDFVAAVHDGRPPTCSAHDALKTQRLIVELLSAS